MKPKPQFAVGDAAWLFDQRCRLPVVIRSARYTKNQGWLYGIRDYGGIFSHHRLGHRDPEDNHAYLDDIRP